MHTSLSLFAACPKGLTLLLTEELKQLGAAQIKEKQAGAAFEANLAVAYRICLWSRLANRILLALHHFTALNAEDLYNGAQQINWASHLNPTQTLAVSVVSVQSEINHTLFAAQKVKDAIIDQFRTQYGMRPSVDREQPDLNIYLHLSKNQAILGIDLSGMSLHKRSYRLNQGEAPLKENLAAALLLRSGWINIAKSGGCLIDPMCGSGTLLIEAAMMAADIAPNLNRDYFGFLGWKYHRTELWQNLKIEAKKRAETGLKTLSKIIGYDQNSDAIHMAFDNITRAGLLGKIHVEKRELNRLDTKYAHGLIITNPPYGKRLGEQEALPHLYETLGKKLRENCLGWQAAILTSAPHLGKQMGIRAKRHYTFFNGKLSCQLLLFDIQSAFFVDRSETANNIRRIRMAERLLSLESKTKIMMFENRLRKNIRHLTRIAKKKGLTTYRIYDSDIPEYAFSIDIKDNAVYVHEYISKKPIQINISQQKRYAVLASLPKLVNLPASHIYFHSENTSDFND